MNKETRVKVVADIQKVLHLLINEDNWCKRSVCVDKNGNPLYDPWSKDADKWCIYGALYACNCSDDTFTYLKGMIKYVGYNDLERFNDLSEHYQIMQFLQFSLNALGGWFKLVKPLYYLKFKKKDEK